MVSINNTGMMPFSNARNCQPLTDRNNQVAFAGSDEKDKIELSAAKKEEIENEYKKVKKSADSIKQVKDSIGTDTKFGKIVKPLIGIAAGVAFAISGFVLGRTMFQAIYKQSIQKRVLPPLTKFIEGLRKHFDDFKAGIKPGKDGKPTLLGNAVNFVSKQAEKANTFLSEHGKNFHINNTIEDNLTNKRESVAQKLGVSLETLPKKLSDLAEDLQKTLKDDVANGLKDEIKAGKISKAHFAAEGIATPTAHVAGSIGGVAMGTYIGSEVYSNDGDPEKAMGKLNNLVKQVGINPDEIQ